MCHLPVFYQYLLAHVSLFTLVLTAMGTSLAEQSYQDTYSLCPRSRASSGVSSSRSLLEPPQLGDSPQPSALGLGRPTLSRDLAPSPAYNSPSLPQSSAFTQPHTSSSIPPFPSLPEYILNANWLDLESQPQPQGTPLLRVDDAHESSEHPTSPSLSSSEPHTTMR